MPLSVYYGVLLFGLVLTCGSAARNLKPGRGLVAFANDFLYIMLLVPALLFAARQLTA
ncbi:MAG: hypothetical protein ACM3N5_10905 [Candidatus Eiseniibacteriota bacterium]